MGVWCGNGARVSCWVFLLGVPCLVGAWQFDTPYLSYDIQSNSQGVALGDINGDGLLDIAASNRFANTVSILLNEGSGTSSTTAQYPPAQPPSE